MSNGPSMTALLGLLAIAGYQNRDKIAEWLGSSGQNPAPAGAQAGQPAPGGLLDSLRGQDAGGFLGGALGGLFDQFKQSGQGDVAESWIGSGPNREIKSPDLERAIGADTLETLSRQLGLSREEILGRLTRELPAAVDRYTPDGRLPSMR